MSKRSATPGISRIDQPEKHNHGYFVRVQRNGIIYSGFFPDKQYGGRKEALEAATFCRQEMIQMVGPSTRMSRQKWAQIPRRKGRSGILGVQRIIDRRVRPWRKYWKATWSPAVGKVKRQVFSIRKYGENEAKRLAIRARRAGLRSMKE